MLKIKYQQQVLAAAVELKKLRRITAQGSRGGNPNDVQNMPLVMYMRQTTVMMCKG